LAGIGLLLIRPKPNGFHAITDLVPGMTVLAIGLVATITPLMSVTLASVPTEHSGMASAINNAVSRLAAMISIGSMGLISVGTASAAGFAYVLELSAALFALGALGAALLITNPPAGCQPVPWSIAALCRDRPGVQPALASSPSAATQSSPPSDRSRDRRNPPTADDRQHSPIHPRFGSRRRITHPGEQVVGVMTAHPAWLQS
jgi:hypothetical protein